MTDQQDARRWRVMRSHLKVLNLDAARWLIWMPKAPAPTPFPLPADIDAAVDRLIAAPGAD